MPVSNEKRTNGGFTLAEALITLVVLGIIAALTVPALKRFSQKETTVMQLKKAYSTMNGALDYAIADDITMDIAKIGGDEFFLNHMLPHMNILKQCSSSNMGDCVSTEAENLPFQPANAAILGDGSTIANNGMDFFVDINGANEPNIAGVDIYQYKLQKVKGDNQAAMKYDFGILMADIMNVLTPKAYAFSFGGPSGGISTSSSRGGSSSSSFGGSSSSSSRITSTSSSRGSSTSSSRGSSTSSSSFGGSSTSSSSLFGSSSSSSRGTSSSSSSFGSTSSSSSRGINDINKPIETQTPADLGGFQNCPAKCGYCGNGIMTPCDQIKGDNTSSSGSTTPNLDPCVVLGTCGGDKPPVNHGPFVPSSGSSVITSSGSNCGSSFTGPNCSSSSGSSSSSKGSTSSGGITTSTSSGSGNSSSGNTSSSSTSGSSSSSGTTSSGTTSSGTSSNGGGEVFPSSSSSSSSSSKINSTSSSSGSSNVPNDEVTEATNTAGWRFVPIGKSAEIMNNNWKIKNW